MARVSWIIAGKKNRRNREVKRGKKKEKKK
jgi:hypothetical protein